MEKINVPSQRLEKGKHTWNRKTNRCEVAAGGGIFQTLFTNGNLYQEILDITFRKVVVDFLHPRPLAIEATSMLERKEVLYDHLQSTQQETAGRKSYLIIFYVQKPHCLSYRGQGHIYYESQRLSLPCQGS